ncbi:hypothetical protein [Actinoplanes sp. NPDC020271]|uniref:hypothetical protein n=1 Tax=Actinoplanes sp. NPDC020271 TaxID=3363896 RepID=UPI00379FF306
MSVLFDRAVRDVEVRAGGPGNCGGVARILADLEPADSFAFVDAHDGGWTRGWKDELAGWCVAAVRQGVEEELIRIGAGEMPPVRFVLRRIMLNLIDSNEPCNREAGRKAVAEAVRRLTATTE